MPFIASNDLTDAATSRSIAAGGMNVHYHEVGEGAPALFLHSYGPALPHGSRFTRYWMNYRGTTAAF